MKNLINALQEGRFVELPETNKEKALNYLANLIEAMPDLPAGTDVAGAVLTREAQFNTGVGQGWACPHMRTSHEGDIICAAGWSPAGIDYGACDHKPVHFVVMYYVPDSQKHVYLKEISGLAKAIQSKQGDKDFSKIQTLAQAREWILDLVSTAVETQMTDVKARMIHLEAKQAAVTSAPGAGGLTLSNLPHVVVPLSILVVPGVRAMVLSQDPDVIAKLESGGEIDTGALAKQMPFDHAGYTVLFRGVTNYQAKRQLYDCLAIKLNGAPPSADKPKV
ncbi:MAG TPA: PTS sugar transporter subunit IIA [Verrucomicrobiae bacterium]|jgi:mannitol/fructose-specific phosphotransferase system IIA component (Ntr-type)|nr:PTS sugar transporter subunit IIA [Verrucomicrobiae bacterium]